MTCACDIEHRCDLHDEPGPSLRSMAMVGCLIVMALSVVSLFGCGASQRETTLKATLVALNTAEAALVTYDAQRQSQIVADAKTLDEGKAALAAYRAKRVPVVEALTAAYKAEAAAAILQTDAGLPGLAAAAAIVVQELKALGVKL